MTRPLDTLHELTSPQLRAHLLELGRYALSDMRRFQFSRTELLLQVLECYRADYNVSAADAVAVMERYKARTFADGVRDVVRSFPELRREVLQMLAGLEDFTAFTRGEKGTIGPQIPIVLGAIRSADSPGQEGALIGACYIQGVMHHAHFVRVKYKDGDEVNEEGDGEQVPWNDDPASICNQWWQDLCHLDEIAFGDMEIAGFPGKYVLYISPGER